MSSTATQVETEQLASTESNMPMEDTGEVQIPIVGRSPRSIVYLDPKETLLVIDVVHKHLPPCPSITIPVLRLVEQHPGDVWKFKAQWKRNVLAPPLLDRMQALFEAHELDMDLFEDLRSVVMGDLGRDSAGVFWFALSTFPVVPLHGETMLDLLTESTAKYIYMEMHFQGHAQRVLTSALRGVSSESGSVTEDPRKAAGSAQGPSPDDLAALSTVTSVVAGAIEKALVGAIGAYMQAQSSSGAPGPTTYPDAASLAPAFRRSMGLGLSPASNSVAHVSGSSARVATSMLSSPTTPFRREHLPSRRSSPFARPVHTHDGGDGLGGYRGGGSPGGNDPDDGDPGGGNPGGGAPGGGNPGGNNPGNNDDGPGGGGGDPGWDRRNRDGFRYPLGREHLLRQRGDLQILHGTTWTHYYCDPNEFDILVDHRTGTLSPWYANRPDFGVTLCHPVVTNVHFMDRELFLSGFLRQFDSRNQQRFAANFPVFDGSGDAITLTDYYGRIVRYSMNFSVYVPPLHTLRDGVPLGVWFDALPSWVQVEAQNSFSGMLAACLKGKSAGLLAHDVLSTIVKQHENGYNALYDLAVYAGHPLLQAYPKPLTEPRQNGDCSLADHLARWLNYIQLTTLHGTHLSDRYFLQQFVGSLHPLIRRAFGSFLEESASRFCLDERLPDSFAPDRLLTKLLQRAAHDGSTKLVHQPPRASVAASQAVQALHSGLDPVFWGESTMLDVAALASASAARVCFFCGDANHLVPDCPRFKTIKSDPFQTRLLQRLLNPAAKPPALKSQPRDAASTPMRQVNFDDQLDVAPLDDSIPLITDDVPADEQAADQQDFL